MTHLREEMYDAYHPCTSTSNGWPPRPRSRVVG